MRACVLLVHSSSRPCAAAADGKLALPRALDIARDVAKGLEELHDLGVVLLDLKPDNVLLTSKVSRLPCLH